MCGDGGVLLVGSPCSENNDGCPMLIHDYFPFSVYVIFSPSLSFSFPFGTFNLLVARKPVSVVACPFVASYLWTSTFARCVVMVITVSVCFLNVVWDLFHCFVTFVADEKAQPFAYF